MVHNKTKKRQHNRAKKRHTKTSRKSKRGGFIVSKRFMDEAASRYYNSNVSVKDTYNVVMDKLIKHSNKKLISYSSLYGLIVKMTIPADSAYYNLFIDDEGKGINEFIMKITFLSDMRTVISSRTVEQIKYNKEQVRKEPFGHAIKEPVSQQEMEHERSIQSKIFKDSINIFGKSIVPDIQFFESLVYDLTQNYDHLIPDPQTDMNGARILREYFVDASNKGVNKIGVFMMKYADGFDTMWNIEDEGGDKKQAVSLYRIYHILLGLLGYVHGDAHGGNIMIKKPMSDKQGITNGYIIDFGRVTTINFKDYKLEPFSMKHVNDTAMLTNYINVVIRHIYMNCDIARRIRRDPPREWACISIAWPGDPLVVPMDIPTIVRDIQKYLTYFINDGGKYRKDILETISMTYGLTPLPNQNKPASPMDTEPDVPPPVVQPPVAQPPVAQLRIVPAPGMLGAPAPDLSGQFKKLNERRKLQGIAAPTRQMKVIDAKRRMEQDVKTDIANKPVAAVPIKRAPLPKLNLREQKVQGQWRKPMPRK